MDIKRNPLSNQQWAWIKLRLIEAGETGWESLAQKHHYHYTSFARVKSYAFPNVEKIIAEAIGLAPQDLFPNRYRPDGKPIGRNYPREIRLSERKKIRNGKDMKRNSHEKAI
jgi:lambda repressor-like predicted transcriptional regulator